MRGHPGEPAQDDDDALLLSEQRLRLALEAGQLGTWEWDIPADRVRWSAGLEAIHGLAPGTFKGTFEAYQEDIHPEDREYVERSIRETLEEGGDHRIHYRIVWPDGTLRWVEGRGKLFRDGEGRPLRMIGVCTDITERKRAEEIHLRLAAIVEGSEDAILSKDMAGVITSWNRGAERLYGYRAADVIGKPVSILIPPDHEDDFPRIMERLRRGEPVEHYETVRIAKDGRRIDVSLTISPIRNREGVIVGASKIARDIGDRKRSEDALREADRRKDEFIATLSHELRNPLAPIRSALELLRMKNPGMEPALIHEILERQVNHLVRLVDDLLEMSRVERGLLELHSERVEVAGVIRSALETSAPLIDQAGHRLELDLPREPLWLEGDGVRLAQIFANLLNNAARFTPRGGCIALAARRRGQSVEISVRDTGVGFSLHARQRLFEMFGRGEHSSGLGIGLALAHRLVGLHGGTIDAKSEGEGRGAEFVVRLPLAEAPAERTPEALAEPALPAEKGSGYRVLVADDNRDAAESLGMLLRILGNEVLLAYDGEEAVEAVHAFRPQVALLDVGMPKLDGYEAARQIRRRSQRIRLVALTGWGQEADRRRAREAGFDAHLVKPAEIDTLRAILAEAAPERRPGR